MRNKRRRKCKSCNELYQPDPRNHRHQKFCNKELCIKASKAESQGRWNSKPENRDYFSGNENIERVRAWRAKNPGYWKRRPRVTEPTVTRCHTPENPSQATENTRETEELALQEILTPLNSSQPLILIGLISKITGATLQDDIAIASRNLIRLGQDVMCGGLASGKSKEASNLSRAGAPSTQAI